MKTQRPSLPLLAALLLAAAPVLAAPSHTGTWSASVEEHRLQLSLRTKGEHGGQMSSPVPLTAFQGLSTAEGSATPFQLIREAGTFHFDGSFANGEGAGHFQFEPSQAYARSMAALGYPKLSPDEHYQLALFDISSSRVKELGALGYKNIPLKQLLEVGIFQVTPEFIREIRAMGYPNVTLEELVKLRIHGISPEYMRALSGVKGDTRKNP
jgi:hypothetical protein